MRWRPSRLLWGVLPLLLVYGIVNIAERPRIEQELTVRIKQTLDQAGLGWAEPGFEGRDGRLGGRAVSEAERRRAVTMAERLHGVRIVEDRAELIPERSPYGVTLSRDENRIKLKGSVPDEATRNDIIGMVRAAFPSFAINDRMELARGAPPRDVWLGGISFGVRQLGGLTEGEVSLTDASIAIHGRARDSASYTGIRRDFEGGLPAGVQRGSVSILPPRIKPFPWSARWRDGRLVLSGYVPDDEARLAVIEAARAAFAGAEIVDQMADGDGAPRGWVEAVGRALAELGRLNAGSLDFADTAITFEGIAQTEETAKDIRGNLPRRLPERYAVGANVQFVEREIATAKPFTLAIESAGDAVVLSGHVPDEATRERLRSEAARLFAGRRIDDRMALARGAPEGWAVAVERGLAGLALLEGGRLAFSDRQVSLEGEAVKEATARDLEARFGAEMPGGFGARTRIAFREPIIPTVVPYAWDAFFDGGRFVLRGHVPDEATRGRLLAAARAARPGVTIVDEMTLANGAPEGFEAAADGLLARLGLLESGRAVLTDKSVDFSGRARGEATARELREGAGVGLPSGFAVAADVDFIEPEVPTVSPFEFAVFFDGKRLRMAGHVPSEEARGRVLEALATQFPGARIEDTATVARGAPEGWEGALRIALAQLARLNEGALSMRDGALDLVGRAQSEATARDVGTAIGGLLPAGFSAQPEIGFVEADLPVADPFTWQAELTGDELVLSGHVPSEEARDLALSLARGAHPGRRIVDRMVLARGVPATGDWATAMRYAIARLGDLEMGSVSLTDLSLSIFGRSRDGDADAALRGALGSSLPGGLELAVNNVEPPLADPFRWSARMAGDTILLDGFVPSERARGDALGELAQLFPGFRINDRMRLASGMTGGEDTWLAMVWGALGALDEIGNGSAELNGAELTVTGRAAREADRSRALERVREIAGLGLATRDEIEVETPPEPRFKWRAALSEGGVELTGGVPDERSRDALVAEARRLFPGRKLSVSLDVRGGRADNWLASARAGLSALARLSEGEAVLDDQQLAVRGTASDSAAAEAARGFTSAALGAGYRGRDEIALRPPAPVVEALPVAAPYRLTAEHRDGRVILEGVVPSEVVRNALVDLSRRRFPASEVVDRLTLARGEPEQYLRAASVAIGQLSRLQNGVATIEGTKVTLSGVSPSREASDKVRTAIDNAMPLSYRANTADIVEPQRVLPKVNVEEVLASTGVIANDVCEVVLNTAAREGTINFAKNSAVLEAESEPTLRTLADVAKRCPDATIEISGHTDSDGEERYNRRLSDERADSVVRYLANAGIERERMVARGYGETRPVAPNTTAANKRLNRRIEFTVLLE